MHRRMPLQSSMLLVLAFWLFPFVSTRAAEPLEVVKSAADRAVQVLQDPELKTPERKTERVARLKEILNPIFDYDEMARRCLGPYWRQRTPAEQEEFARLFRAFIEKTYSEKIDFYKSEKIVFGRETIDRDYAQVDSTVINPKGEAFSVVYRLKRSDGQWRVYDAVVENISIVNNYRTQFERVISKSSYEELKKMLKEKAG